MNQRAGLVIVIVCAACGGSRPEPAPVVSNGSGQTELACKVAIERASAKVKVDDKDVTMAVGECERKEWSRQARECIAAAEKDADLAACAAKNGLAKDGMFAERLSFEEAMKQMTMYRDQICACKDAACAQKVSDDMTKWAQEMSKAKEPPKPTDEQMKSATEIGEQMGKCMQKAMGAGTP